MPQMPLWFTQNKALIGAIGTAITTVIAQTPNAPHWLVIAGAVLSAFLVGAGVMKSDAHARLDEASKP